jgi:hypothetical protein
MRYRLAILAALATVPLWFAWPSAATPDPTTCAGYPEARIFVENQSWWSPQLQDPARPGHPGEGGTGHIHIGTCFPLYQHLTADTLDLDVNIKLHENTGTAVNLRVYAYGDVELEYNGTQPFNHGKCDTADCDTWVHVSFPLSQAHYNGWHEFAIFLNVLTPDGQVQRNWTRYYAYIDRSGLPSASAGSVVDLTTRPVISGVNSVTGGDSWYSKMASGGSYAQAKILRSSIPWDETTGALTPLAGVWSPRVGWGQPGKFAYVDPAFHAVPPSKGTIVFENGPVDADGFKTLTIDTTHLANGMHRLVLGAGNAAANGTNTGVLVVPFLVANPTGCGQ